MVKASGRVVLISWSSRSVVSGAFAENAANSPATTLSSISAPLKPSVASASFAMSNVFDCCFRRARWMSKIDDRTAGVGRSTKNTSSNRPLRMNSGGSRDTSFDVATTNTSPRRSWSQARNEPNTRRDTPPSVSSPPWAKAFSNSSIQRITGAMRSAVCNARLKFFSLSPMYLS